MPSNPSRLITVLALAIFLSGCLHEQSDPMGIVVIDMNKVAEETGRSRQINEILQATRQRLKGQLDQLRDNLQKQLAERKSAIGEKPSEDQTKELAQMTADAQRRLQQGGLEMQQTMQQQLSRLNQAFIDEVRPIAREAARKNGAQVVLAKGPLLIDASPKADITNEVVLVMIKQPPPATSTNAN